MKPDYKSKIFLIGILLLGQLIFYCSGAVSNWDYVKGGADWSGSCKEGDQAPIDISKPFTFKSKNLIKNIIKFLLL